MKVVHDAPGLERALAEHGVARRAVVMTMGALHTGHLALVRRARELADQVVVTVFVNPLQFGAGEDLDRYPRDLVRDLTALEPLMGDLDVVFAPSVNEMYPRGPATVRVCAGEMADRFEGAVRPGHFDGVLTVVLKLLHRTHPQVAVFGAKDAQQLAVVRAMVRDLDVAVDVVEVPTVRDRDGLAWSSRNAFLSAEERDRAVALPRALAAGAQTADTGGSALQVVMSAQQVLEASVDGVDYVAAVDSDFLPVADDRIGPVRLIVAARVGQTRLIDNREVVLNPRGRAIGRGTDKLGVADTIGG